MIPIYGRVYELPESARSLTIGGSDSWFSVQRLPTDPLFYADIILQNIVAGSRYWIAQASDLTNVLTTGVAADTEVTLANIPAYANPMLVEVRVRNASGSPAYQPYVTYGYLVRDGATVYIAQIEDSVNA
jgi:hypothetical protein